MTARENSPVKLKVLVAEPLTSPTGRLVNEVDVDAQQDGVPTGTKQNKTKTCAYAFPKVP